MAFPYERSSQKRKCSDADYVVAREGCRPLTSVNSYEIRLLLIGQQQNGKASSKLSEAGLNMNS